MLRIIIETDERGGPSLQLPGGPGAQAQIAAAQAQVAGAQAPVLSGGVPPAHLHQLIASQVPAPRAQVQGGAGMPGTVARAIDAGVAPQWLHESVRAATVRAAEEIIKRGKG